MTFKTKFWPFLPPKTKNQIMTFKTEILTNVDNFFLLKLKNCDLQNQNIDQFWPIFPPKTGKLEMLTSTYENGDKKATFLRPTDDYWTQLTGRVTYWPNCATVSGAKTSWWVVWDRNRCSTAAIAAETTSTTRRSRRCRAAASRHAATPSASRRRPPKSDSSCSSAPISTTPIDTSHSVSSLIILQIY